MIDDKQEITPTTLRAETEEVVNDAFNVVSENSEESTTDSSSETQTEEKEVETQEQSEDTTSQKSEDAQEKDTEIPKEFHKHPAWQRILSERDKYKEQLTETQDKTALSESDRAMLEEVKKVTSSPEYISTKMKAEGYTQEAIDNRLKQMGHQVDARPDDMVSLVANKLNIDMSRLDQQSKTQVENYIHDIASVANVLVEQKLNNVLPEMLKPIEQNVNEISQVNNASKMAQTIQDTVNSEGVLDYDKDIVPALNEYMDKNPNASQEDVFEYFKEINHKLSIERFKLGSKQKERDGKRANLKGNKDTETASNEIPKYDGGDISAYADNLLDLHGIRN